MPYPGVPKELTPKMDSCVKKVMKDGKDKSSAIAICETSIMNQKEAKKEEPYEVVSSKEKKPETRLVYFSQDEIKKVNASKEGKILRNVEIFKSGTYRGIQFKNSGLDKMVANFYFLKAFNIFPNVPVRADHPSEGIFGGGGNIIDNIGGYIQELKRKGNKLIADFRITSQKMWDKIMEGSYVSRSAEIGTYDDNNGIIYSPILYGVAWVDIPQVEGLSPTFNYSRDNKDIELINLNTIMNMTKKEKFSNDEFPPKEEVKKEKVEEKKEEEKKEEYPEEEKDIEEEAKWTTSFINNLPDAAFAYIEPGGKKDKEGKTVPRSKRHFPHHNAKVTNGNDNSTVDKPHLRNALARAPQSPFGKKALPHLEKHAKALGIGDYNKLKLTSMEKFEKEFPKEAKELKALREEKEKMLLESREAFIDKMEKEGKVLPAQVEAEKEFVKKLDKESYEKYKELKKNSKAIVKLDKEEVEKEEGKDENKEKKGEKTSEEKADEFLKETK